VLIDLHSHSFLSDGELCPVDLLWQAELKGYGALAVTDHVDPSNLESVVEGLVKACREVNRHRKIRAIPGVELTHCPPASLKELVPRAREAGAVLVVVHGETPVEPVEPGTNRAAIEAGADLLAHPGLIPEEDLRLAKERGIALEITSRKGHSLTNGHLATLNRIVGAQLVINSDAHGPGDLLSETFWNLVGKGAGLTDEELKQVRFTSESLLNRCLARMAPRPPRRLLDHDAPP
jgi:histidinol phosphatase-like PHP family hydrolase